MKSKLKPYTIIILILCILVGIYFLWPIITDESDSVLAEGAIDGNSSISNVEQLWRYGKACRWATTLC